MWTVITTDLFNEWLEQQDESTQEKVLAALVVLQQQGPSLGRPLVDTVYDSKFTNMKELRVQHRGKPLRAFFAFDPLRQAIVLCIGDKGGNPPSKTFDINQPKLLKTLGIQSFKGDSNTKADINVSHEYNGKKTSSDPWGIKSFLGSCPTLLNAGSTTNFIYEIVDFNADMNAINNISTRSKIKDRIKAIYQSGATLKFSHCENEIFHENLRKTDSLMPEYISDILIKYYSGLGSNLTDLIDNDVIRIRVTDFLKAVLLGMFSSKPWDGKYNCNGLLVIRPQGDLLLYHVIKDNDLKDYLFKNTRLDTASSTRHRFGSIYQERNGKYYFKLNLQIRNK